LETKWIGKNEYVIAYSERQLMEFRSDGSLDQIEHTASLFTYFGSISFYYMAFV